MRRTIVLAAAALLLVAGPPASLAEGDPRREARLLYSEGKFQEAEDLLRKAGLEADKDAELRSGLADAALIHVKSKTGEERRTGLEAAKRNYAAVVAIQPENGAALVGAVVAAKEIARLDIARKNSAGAAAQATWALALGEKAAVGAMTPEIRAALGEAYGIRAGSSRKVDEADRISADFRKGAQMLEEAAAGHANASAWLAAAADLRFREASFIHDSIPLPTEKRDDESIVAAAQLARRACESPNAQSETFALHIATLCAAKSWKVEADLGAPIMEPLAPALPGLALQVPKGVKWKRGEPTSEWQLVLERTYDSADGTVQIMVTSYSTKSAIGAKSWAADMANAATTLFQRRRGGYDEVASESAPEMFGDKKKGPQVWTWSVAGVVTGSSRRNKQAEWVWIATAGKDVVWDVRIVDWRHSTSVDDPDLVEFVKSAVPPGTWPPGQPEAEDPKGRKPPVKKK